MECRHIYKELNYLFFEETGMKKTIIIFILCILLSSFLITSVNADSLKKLDVIAPQQYNEGECLELTIKDNTTQNGINNATILSNFISTDLKTNETGKCSYCYIDIPKTDIYQINITKEGYESYFLNITIIDFPKLYLNISGNKRGDSYENEILITVKDEYGNLIDGANVTIISQSNVEGGFERTSNGKVIFSIENTTVKPFFPSPPFYYEYLIFAEANGYQMSDLQEVTIANCADTELIAWFSSICIISIIIILLIVIVIVIIVLRISKRKKK